MSEKPLKPAIRFKGFTNAWEQYKLKELTKFSNGKGHEDSQTSSGNYELINLNSISIDGGLKPSGRFVNVEEETLKVNDLVMVLSDVGHGDLLGRVAIIPQNDRFILNQRVALVRPNELINPKYLYFYINANQRYFKMLGAGSSQLNISKSTVEDFIVMKAHDAEQEKIQLLFSELDTLITLHQRKLDMLVNVKKSLLQTLFPSDGEKLPKTRFKGFTNAWELHRLGDLGSTFTGLSGKSVNDFGHGDAKFITYLNVFRNPIGNVGMIESIEIDKKQNQVRYGDVMFTTSSETPEEVGMSSIWLHNADNIYLNSFSFGYRPSINFDPYYLGFMLRSPSVRKDFVLLAQGISRYNISKTKAMDIKIPVPNFKEQKLVGNFFKDLDNLITLHQRKLETLRNIKKSLLSKMFV